MINLSNYHSNGLPTAVWSNKVNLIGEKVYKPKLHFCEHCNKPILIYGRLIPCKHVFCFTCATLCLTASQQLNRSNSSARSPPQTHNGGSNHIHNQSVASPHEPPLPPPPNQHYHQSPLSYNNNSMRGNNIKNYNDHHHQRRKTPTRTNNHGGRSLDLHRTDSNHSLSSRDNHNANLDESTNNTTPTTIQQDMSIDSPSFNGTDGSPTTNKGNNVTKGCHRCGGKALRVERNTLNSIFVCQIETCCRTYLSARDLQAHVNHRHARSKSGKSNPSASIAAISSSPYISSSTLMHLSNQHSSSSASRDHTDHSDHHNSSRRHGKNSQPSSNHHHPSFHNRHERGQPRDRFRDRDNYQRDRERERDSKEYHRQSLQRAAQWAEQSAQIMEKGLTR